MTTTSSSSEPDKERPEDEPDLVILSVPVQDALVLKWALESGVAIDLVLRSQGDIATFFTSSVSLPQMVEQAGVTIPEYPNYDGWIWDLAPRTEEVPPPNIPAAPPSTSDQ